MASRSLMMGKLGSPGCHLYQQCSPFLRISLTRKIQEMRTGPLTPNAITQALESLKKDPEKTRKSFEDHPEMTRKSVEKDPKKLGKVSRKSQKKARKRLEKNPESLEKGARVK